LKTDTLRPVDVAMTAPSPQQKRILVVDDEPFVVEAMKMMLMHDGHAVETASSGPEALGLFERGSFDLVITDYAMPGMKGNELATAIKARAPQLPVIMVTAYSELVESSGIPLPGVECVLSKPFLMANLREAIAEAFTD
jgi:CheY-like chemotaxis protein